MNEDEIWERLLELAKEAHQGEEVPIASIIVKDNRIVGEAFNETEARQCFTAHAEMIALERASQNLKSKHLNDCHMYLSVEPCQMCLAAAKLCRIKSIRYLLASQKFGAEGPAYRELELAPAQSDKFSESQLDLLQSFFRNKR